ncbi:GFA family protein [Microvirga pudoricolor]|uniref:GFA family protein n=1 Tax=Microvirga pudoricolor TaxID=2778729 RepID=UPI00195215D6|nr:GFA family protein [Microvirga pudoricolor]MBM6593789.1 GFA family protein [Microvirga pudoricolor]
MSGQGTGSGAVRTGGCACGQLTFEARGEPKRVGLCHCMTCRKISGSAFNAYVIYPADRVAISGERRGWSDTPATERFSCVVCGSPVFDRDAADEVELLLGAFDAPNLFAPTYECWTRRRETWLELHDLRSFPENREA